MADIIKVDYDLMEEMIQTFRQAAEQLEETMGEAQTIAIMLEDGALLGNAGEAFTDGIRTKLSPAVQRLANKMTEMANDVQSVVASTRATEGQVEQSF